MYTCFFSFMKFLRRPLESWKLRRGFPTRKQVFFFCCCCFIQRNSRNVLVIVLSWLLFTFPYDRNFLIRFLMHGDGRGLNIDCSLFFDSFSSFGRLKLNEWKMSGSINKPAEHTFHSFKHSQRNGRTTFSEILRDDNDLFISLCFIFSSFFCGFSPKLGKTLNEISSMTRHAKTIKNERVSFPSVTTDEWNTNSSSCCGVGLSFSLFTWQLSRLINLSLNIFLQRLSARSPLIKLILLKYAKNVSSHCCASDIFKI